MEKDLPAKLLENADQLTVASYTRIGECQTATEQIESAPARIRQKEFEVLEKVSEEAAH